MVKEYLLDAKDEEILNELDNLCGVVHNKETLKDMIIYTKLKQNNELDFGNYNIIIRNNSSYLLLNDFLKVCSKILFKYGIIENNKICTLDKIVNNRRDYPLDKITGIEAGIIIINERKLRIDYAEVQEDLKRIIDQNPNKVFVFEDTGFTEGYTDAEIGEFATWRMTIEKISLEDKTVYCENLLNTNNIEYKRQDIKEYADVPFWTLKNMLLKLIVECKSNGITSIDKQVLKKNKEAFNIKTTQSQRNNKTKKKETVKTAKEELDELIGLEDVKEQMEKILNYIRLNKERGKMPTLHMCFNGNPGTGKTSIARIIGKIFDEEKILSGSGEFVEIHGRDLVAKYVGWTAQKVHDTIEKAIGGVLFIDEAYSLVSDLKGGFEDEAIATLIKEMEDHRDEICIILAGYTEEMKNLIKTNPGFESRIQFTINFPNYNENELLNIFEGLCKKEKYKLSKNCDEILLNNFKTAKNSENFGNGRYARNLFEKTKFEQADRVIKNNNKDKNLITVADLKNAIENMVCEPKEKIKIGFRA